MPFLPEVVLNVRIKLQIRNKANDTIIESDITDAVASAVILFSVDRGLRKVKDYLGNGLSTIPLPGDWDTVSAIEQFWIAGEKSWDYRLEDKVDLTERAIQNVASGTKNLTLVTASDAYFFQDDDVVAILNNGTEVEQNWIAHSASGAVVLTNATAAAYSTAPKLRRRAQIVMTKDAPSAAEIIRLYYTKTHVLTDAENTIDPRDQEAFEHLGAALTAQRIAAKYANTQAPPMATDTIDFQSKRAEWTAIYKNELEIYTTHIKKTTKPSWI